MVHKRSGVNMSRACSRTQGSDLHYGSRGRGIGYGLGYSHKLLVGFTGLKIASQPTFMETFVAVSGPKPEKVKICCQFTRWARGNWH